MKKRIIIKIGTKALSKKGGSLDVALINHLVSQIARIKRAGTDVILVTSGAVGSGRSLINLKDHAETIEKQALAAIGQVKLMGVYSDACAKRGLLCAQVLVTKEDFRDRKHYSNMKNCFEKLLKSKILPIVNENDVVATDELIFTDNDELTGLVAGQMKADKAIILTSVEGFLVADKGKRMRVVPEIGIKDARTYRKHVSRDTTTQGRGGMASKFRVSTELARHGSTVWIADGKRKNILIDILKGKNVGTKFSAEEKI